MLKNKGVTITSLTIYVVVATIIVGILTFLNIKFMSNITELSSEANITNESLDFKASFLRDIKGDVTLQEYSSNKLKLSNDVIYEIRKLDDPNGNEEKYAIFRNDVKIVSHVEKNTINSTNYITNDNFFNYIPQMHIVNTNWVYINGNNKSIETGSYLVGDKTNYDLRGGISKTYGTEVREVYYHSNDTDNKTKTQFISEGNLPIVLDGVFYKSGYTVSGYSLTPDGDIEYLIGDILPETVTDLYAKWRSLAGVVNVKFYAGEGSFDSSATSFSINNVKYDIVSSNPDITTSIVEGRYVVPSYSNMLFNGWTISSSGTGKIFRSHNSLKEVLIDGIELYAHYVSNTNSTYLSGTAFNSIIKRIAGNVNATEETVDTNIHYIKWSNEEPSEAVKIDSNKVSQASSAEPIYAWFENGTIYLWSQAQDISLPSNCSGMLENLRNLEEIDLANDMHIVDTSNCLNLSSFFENDANLRRIFFDNFNTSNVTNMSSMFAGCTSLTNIDLSRFNTSKVTTISSMFKEMKSITSINLKNFNTSRVTDMSYLFDNCQALRTVNVSSFDTTRVTTLENFFNQCYALDKVDLTNFDTANVTNFKKMFYKASALKTINASDAFKASSTSNTTSMFDDCNNLVGGRGTTYSYSTNYKPYIRIDGGRGTPGYFTGETTQYAIKVGDQYYDSLQIAIDDADSEVLTKLTLLKDISENFTVSSDKIIEIDLQSFQISNSAKDIPVIENHGTLTLKSGSIYSDCTNTSGINNESGGKFIIKGNLRYISEGSKQAIYNNGGRLEIQDNVYIEANSTIRATVHTLSNGTTVITGGTIVSTGYSAILNDEATLIVGDSEDDEIKATPTLRGTIYGINTNCTFDFYDGAIMGKTSALNKESYIVSEEDYRLLHSTEYVSGDYFSTIRIGDQPVEYEVIYRHNGNYVFDGNDVIVIDTPLFTSDNYAKDFVISFKIVSFDNSFNTNQSTLVSCKNENSSRYPGFSFRYKDASGNLELSCREGTTMPLLGNILPIAEGMTITIRRNGGIISLSQNDSMKYQYNYQDFTYYFDTPLTIGASYKSNAIFRPFKGTLSNIIVKVEKD
ncbi:MAG: BspA family leucine-rich repeat surface protein [Clostridia bacterium]|nr:BspA family leucine-rich repeat surface protein [Clostridia bacterium]